MRTVGLIGGMSFESSSVYYRLINESIRRRLGSLHSAEVILHSVDFQTIADMQSRNRWAEAGERLSQVARSLEVAGAECVLICTNTMHLVADAVEDAITVPLINIIDVTASRLQEFGSQKPLLLATRYTMEQGFYAKRMKMRDIEVMIPNDADRAATHSIIFEELCAGKVLDSSRLNLLAIIERSKKAGADAVILGCTELGLILDATSLPLPCLDSTSIHCDAAVEFALN
jgi:aspartate racemase